MKFESIKPLTRIKALKPLTKEKFKRGKYLNEIEMILYSTNLCYYSSRILRNEIIVNNREIILNNLMMEIYRIYKILCNENWYNLDTALTQKEVNENFKLFGITKKSLEH
ncbi:hypothetical protein [Aliarcobacter cryaerophilus]|uniref:hypothetical protein n=1 Tax=Aliarcobacter cryaerophilus TaxID=28198 RepID=UPI0021B442B4|nr:hypothetical protein [Aliarcobacter cryaerophilus]MCT7498432.1 hypothetical protein [Aliarcobacter cryaerophilus]MCT7543622.1 hypothetical protein [Aliarcobacter cryaerophilus]